MVSCFAIERKQAEELLHQSEEKFARSFRSSPVAIAISTVADGRYIEVNDRFMKLFGFRREEIIGHTSVELGIFHDSHVRQEIARRFRADGGVQDYETQLWAKSGQSLEVLFSAEPMTVDGQDCTLSLTVDITERKQAEAALRTSEERMTDFLESMHEYFAALDFDYRVLYITQRFARVLGHEVKDLIGQTFWAEFPQYKGTLAEQNYRKAMEERVPVKFQMGGVYTLYWYDISIYPTKEGISIFATDRTEEKKAQQALIEQGKRLRRLMEGNIIGINVRDTDGHLQDANATFLEMIGYSGEDLASGQLTVQNLTPASFLEIDQQAVTEALTSGSCKPYEKEYLHKDGHTIPAMVGYTCLDENEGNLIGFVLDLTELKQAQNMLQDYTERLQQSNQELERFAFVASHDLQEPLRKIKAFGMAIQQNLAGKLDQDTQDYFQRMLNASDRMQAMIQDLLELSRVNTRAQPFVQVDLTAVATEVVSDLESRILSTGGQVHVEMLPSVEADPIQIYQMMQNLIGNALKFHKPDVPPVVMVTSSKGTARNLKNAMVTIHVQDNGIGFDEAQFERILRPFQRLHGHGEYEGTGIGLAIVKKIVERHHGMISAHSALGEGSIFTITLPTKQAD